MNLHRMCVGALEELWAILRCRALRARFSSERLAMPKTDRLRFHGVNRSARHMPLRPRFLGLSARLLARNLPYAPQTAWCSWRLSLYGFLERFELRRIPAEVFQCLRFHLRQCRGALIWRHLVEPCVQVERDFHRLFCPVAYLDRHLFP